MFAENEVDELAFKKLTESDLRLMYPGKVGIVKKLLVFMETQTEVSYESQCSNSRDTEVIADVNEDVLAFESYTMVLPKFKEEVELILAAPVIDKKNFHMVVAETASFLLFNGDIKTKSEYEAFGKQMLKRYPSLNFSGTSDSRAKPWGFFCRKLSEKLRNLRWKRSHPPVPSHGKRSASLGFLQLQRVADSEWTKEKAAEFIRQQLQKEESEWEYSLLKQAFNANAVFRQEAIRLMKDGCVSEIIEKFPLLGHMPFIEEEFKNVYEYDCNAIEEAYVIMLTTLDKIFNSNVERQCDETEDPSQQDELNLFLRLQKQLQPTRKTNLFDTIQTVDAFRINLNSRKKTPPSLLVSYNEAGTMQAFIVADSIHITCNNDSRVVLGYLMQLIGCYYAWQLQYPKVYPILGFLQAHLLKDSLCGYHKSSKYVFFEKQYEHVTL
ncbi:uncharacterized protein LOC143464715 [Clavelina lepadiformis]|uniref:uncharacterized protein LOC143464715 n=1 Tax=Clavelina lepadiformis TaxID=159417 RepID=UPI0040418EE9